MTKSLTIVSVTGAPDASGALLALQASVEQLPWAQALLLCPVRPVKPLGKVDREHIPPMDYAGYNRFIVHELWKYIHTDYALIVQQDGWVLHGDQWRDDFFDFDYIGSVTHVALTDKHLLMRGFEWDKYTSHPVLNGGFSLRSRRLMQEIAESGIYPVAVDDALVSHDPILSEYRADAMLEDVQISALMRDHLEAKGFQFPSVKQACQFSMEHCFPGDSIRVAKVFGHHSRLRQLVDPKTIHYRITEEQAHSVYGEREVMREFDRLGYALTFERAS